MDKQTQEQSIQEMKEFMAKPCYDWIRNEYNKRIIKKLQMLHENILTKEDKLIHVLAGELSGFKNGFELIEKLIEESERKEG